MSYLQEVVGGAYELLCSYACMLTIAQMCQNFHCAKKFSPTACIGEIGEDFLLAKISVKWYALISQYALKILSQLVSRHLINLRP